MKWVENIPKVGEKKVEHRFCLFPYTFHRKGLERDVVETYWLEWITVVYEYGPWHRRNKFGLLTHGNDWYIADVVAGKMEVKP